MPAIDHPGGYAGPFRAALTDARARPECQGSEKHPRETPHASALLAQVVDISFWWLARLQDPYGSEFANAIRGTEEITMVPFETGVHYMEWTEAVIRSAQTGQRIYLPL